MAKNSVIKVGIQLTGMEEQIKDISKQLDAISEQAGGKLSKGAAKEIAEIKGNIKDLNDTIGELGNSKMSKKGFSDVTKRLNEQMVALEKRTSILEGNMAELMKTMSSSDGAKMATSMDTLRASMDGVVNSSKNVITAVTDIRKAVSSNEKIEFVDASSVSSLQKESKLLTNVLKKIDAINSGKYAEDSVDLGKLSDVLGAQKEIRDIVKEISSAEKEIESIGNSSNSEDLQRRAVLIDNIVSGYSKLAEAMLQYNELYPKIKISDSKIDKLLKDRINVIAKYHNDVVNRIGDINRALAGVGNNVSLEKNEETNKQTLTVPMDISTTPKGLITKAEYVIEQTQKAISRTPLEVQFVLVSGYSSKKTNALLKNFQKQINDLEDEASRSGLQEVYDKIAKDFSKQIDIDIVSTSLDGTTKKILESIDKIKKEVARGADFAITDITVSEGAADGLQQRLDDISKGLVLNINKLAISKDATLKAVKDQQKNEELKKNKKTTSEISAEAAALSKVIDRIVGKLNSINKDTLVPISSSLSEIKDILTSISAESLGSVFASDTIISSIKEVTSSLQTAFGILSNDDLDKMFLGIQKNVSEITGDLRNPAIKQSVEEVLALYKEYQKLGGSRDISELGGENNVQKWLKKNVGEKKSGLQIDISPVIDENEFIQDIQGKIKGKQISIDVLPNIEADEFVKQIQSLLVGKDVSIDLDTEKIKEIANAISSLGEKSEPLKYINNMISKLKDEDTAQSIIVSLEAIRDIFTEPISNENNLINSLSTLASYGDTLKDVAELLKTSSKKVKETVDAIQSQEQSIDLNGQSGRFKSSAEDYLSGQGLSVINTDVEKTKNGLIQVTALVKNLDDEYQKYILTVNSAGEVEERQVKTLTSDVAKQLEIYAKVQKAFERMNSTPSNITEDSFFDKDSDPETWELMISLAEKYADKIGELRTVTRQVRQDKEGNLLESFSLNGTKGHLTIGKEGETVASSQTLTNVDELIERISKLKKSAKEYYSLKEKFLSGNISEKELSVLNDIEDEYRDINEQVDSLNSQNINVSSVNEKISKQIRDMNIMYSDMQYSYLDKADAKINDALKNPNNKNSSYITSFNIELKEANNKISELRALIDKNGKDFSIWTSEDINKVIELRTQIDKIVSRLKDQGVTGAKTTSLDKLLSKVYSDINDNTAMPKDLKLQYSYLAEEIKNARDNAEDLSEVDYRRLNSQFQELHANMLRVGKTGNSLTSMVSKAIKSNTAQFIARYFSFQDWIRYGRELYETIKSIDTALTELRKVSDATEQRLTQNFETSAKTAKELGTTITDVINATSDWSRLNKIGLPYGNIRAINSL